MGAQPYHRTASAGPNGKRKSEISAACKKGSAVTEKLLAPSAGQTRTAVRALFLKV